MPKKDGLVSYPGLSLGESYPSAVKQLMCSTAPANWVKIKLVWMFGKRAI